MSSTGRVTTAASLGPRATEPSCHQQPPIEVRETRMNKRAVTQRRAIYDDKLHARMEAAMARTRRFITSTQAIRASIRPQEYKAFTPVCLSCEQSGRTHDSPPLSEHHYICAHATGDGQRSRRRRSESRPLIRTARAFMRNPAHQASVGRKVLAFLLLPSSRKILAGEAVCPARDTRVLS